MGSGNAADPLTWVQVLAVFSPLVGAVIAVSGVIGTIIFTNRRERTRQEHERQLARDRQEHERQLKQEELEDQRKSRLREERIQAYVALFALARGARAASHRDQRPVAQPGGRALLEDLREARASVELLRETQQLDKHAEALYDQCKEFLEREQWDEADKKEADKEYRRAREDFLEWARYELGLRSRPPDS